MRRVLVPLLALLVLAGCVTVPTSGPVERHSPAVQPANPGVDIAPVPPAQGASPGLIVEGFLHAMATYQPGYSVARQFLTPQASGEWNPETGVEVYAGGYPPQVSGTGVVLTAPLIGTVDTQGSFTPASTQYHHDFGLVRDADGQWRISRPPAGLLISQSLFASTWVRSDVCLWDDSGSWLVPDPRFVPSGTIGLVQTVRAILAGPSRGLEEALRAGPAADGSIDVPSVALAADGAATVDLTGGVDLLDAEARRSLAAELVWSLTSLEGVSEVRIRGNGAVWELGSAGGVLTTADFGDGTPQPASTGEGVFLIRDGSMQRASWVDPSADPLSLAQSIGGASAIDARYDGGSVAVITDQGTRVRSVGVRDGVVRSEMSGSRLADVRWDRQGELWVVLDRGRGQRMRMVRDGQEIAVDAAGLPVGTIRAFSPAPDGVRVALVVENQGRSTLGTAAVVRSADGVRFVGWRELTGATWAPSGQPALDVGWAGPADLLVLLGAGGGGGAPRVVSVDSAGAVATDVGPSDAAGAAQLAVSASGRAVLRGPDGQTWRFVDDFTWEPWLQDVDAVSLP